MSDPQVVLDWASDRKSGRIVIHRRFNRDTDSVHDMFGDLQGTTERILTERNLVGVGPMGVEVKPINPGDQDALDVLVETGFKVADPATPASPALTAHSRVDDSDAEMLDRLFSYHPPANSDEIERYGRLRAAGRTFAETILDAAPSSADRTTALRNVRAAVMWANAAIACDPERGS